MNYSFATDTEKLDSLEEEIEEVMDSGKLDEFTAVNDKIGVCENREDLLEEYPQLLEMSLDEIKKLNEKIKELEEKHNKDIADIIMGRKEVEEVQKREVENDDKSYFDKQVEETKKKLGKELRSCR